MTTRMTWAITAVTLGFALAALAGIPALIENRSIGDVVVVVGLAIAVLGLVLTAFAIPGQIRAPKEAKKAGAHEVDALKHERGALIARLHQAHRELSRAESPIGNSISKVMLASDRDRYEDRLSAARKDLKQAEDALLENELKLRRLGVVPDEPRST